MKKTFLLFLFSQIVLSYEIGFCSSTDTFSTAERLFYQKKYADAQKYYLLALTENHSNKLKGYTKLQIAECSYQQKNLEDAKKFCYQVIKDNAKDKVLLDSSKLHLANIYYLEGKEDEANKIMDEIESNKPSVKLRKELSYLRKILNKRK